MTSHKSEATNARDLMILVQELRQKTEQAEETIRKIKVDNNQFTGTFRPLGMLIATEITGALNRREKIDFEEAKEFLELGSAIAESITAQRAISEEQVSQLEGFAKKYLPDQGRGFNQKRLEDQAGVFKKNAVGLKNRLGMRDAKQQAIVGALVGMLVVATVVTALVAAGPTFGASLFLLLPLGLVGAGVGLPKALNSGLISSLLSSKTQDTAALNTGPTAGEQLKGLKEGLDAIKQKGESSDESRLDPNVSADL